MKVNLSRLVKFLVGIVIACLIFYGGMQLSYWAIGAYNRSEYEKRVKGEYPVSNLIYYLSPNGSDANDGRTLTTAWATINKLNQINFQPGDQILFEGGKEFVGNLSFDNSDIGTPTNPIKISSFGESRAVIKADIGSGISIENSMGFEISNLDISGLGKESNRGDGIAVINNLRGDVKLEHFKIHSVQTAYFGEHGIKFDSTIGKSGFRNVLIEDVVARDNATAGIYVYGEFSLTSNSFASEKIIIRRAKAFNNSGHQGKWKPHSGSGIVISDVDGGLIEYSTAYNNGWLCDSKHGGPVGIWAWDVNNIIIQHNESFDNKTGGAKDGGGFDLDGGAKNSVLQYNYSHGNEGAGFLLMQFTDGREWANNIVRYNVSENDGQKNDYAAIQVWGNTLNIQIYNNTVISNSEKSSDKSLVISPNTDTNLNEIPKSVFIANNIFVVNGTKPIVEVIVADQNINFKNNNYFAFSGNLQINWNQKIYQNLMEWSENTAQERNAQGFTGLSVEPQFKNCSLSEPAFSKSIEYCLDLTSALIDKGLDLKNALNFEIGSRDFKGTPTPINLYDIGAFEAEK